MLQHKVKRICFENTLCSAVNILNKNASKKYDNKN